MKFGLATATVAAAKIELAPYPGYSGPLKVTGTVGGYLYGEKAYVWYSMRGLEKECAEAPAGVANACGIHIHEGKTCDDADSVGGHYYNHDSITSDPWSPLTYETSRYGSSTGRAEAGIGAGQDIRGRAIVVHDKTGGRVACALIDGKLEQKAAGTKLAPYPGYTGPLKVTGNVGAYLYHENAYLWYQLGGLEKECEEAPEGVANACGIHIHEGKTCDDADSVGGHYYNHDSITSDPWSPLTYKATRWGSSTGRTMAGIGADQDINGRAIVVHDKTGGRVACALIEGKLEQKAAGMRLAPYPGYSGPLKVTGNVGAYLYRDNAYVWYQLGGLEKECAEAPAGVANACGIHIHEGMTCDDADSVGGHYYNHDSITSDPWSPVTYKASPFGSSWGTTSAGIGDGQNINGRAIVVHDKTGGRVACALIEGKIATELEDTNLTPYPGYSGPLTVTGSVGGFLLGEDAYVWYSLSGLEAECATTPEGVANACGIHIHEGKTCEDADAVGGHYYDHDSLASDPWSPVTYTSSTDGKSKGKTFAGIGAGQDINGRAIVVHDKTGGRVACALIQGKLPVMV